MVYGHFDIVRYLYESSSSDDDDDDGDGDECDIVSVEASGILRSAETDTVGFREVVDFLCGHHSMAKEKNEQSGKSSRKKNDNRDNRDESRRGLLRLATRFLRTMLMRKRNPPYVFEEAFVETAFCSEPVRSKRSPQLAINQPAADVPADERDTWIEEVGIARVVRRPARAKRRSLAQQTGSGGAHGVEFEIVDAILRECGDS